MNYGKITQAYQNTERQALQETEDPHFIVLTMFNELLKSMRLFAENADLKSMNPGSSTNARAMDTKARG